MQGFDEVPQTSATGSGEAVSVVVSVTVAVVVGSEVVSVDVVVVSDDGDSVGEGDTGSLGAGDDVSSDEVVASDGEPDTGERARAGTLPGDVRANRERHGVALRRKFAAHRIQRSRKQSNRGEAAVLGQDRDLNDVVARSERHRSPSHGTRLGVAFLGASGSVRDVTVSDRVDAARDGQDG